MGEESGGGPLGRWSSIAASHVPVLYITPVEECIWVFRGFTGRRIFEPTF